MQNKIIQFTLAALIVMIVGGFGGWYFFIKSKTAQTIADAGGRGSDSTSFTGQVGSTYRNITADQPGSSTVAEIGKQAPRLWHVTKTPVAGFGFGPGGTSVYIAERATGNILRADPQTSSILRLTNTLIPKVRDALFSRSGDVILRSTNDAGTITSFAATIATTTVITSTSTANVLEGTYLPPDIVAIDVANNQPTSHGLFFMTHLPEGGSLGVSANWKGGSVKKIFSSPLFQWRAQLLADGRVVITQSASDDIAGYSFMVAANGVTRTLMSDVRGLTVLHHETSAAYLYGSSDAGKLSLYVKVGSSKAVKLSIETTADKCTWAPGTGLIAYCAVPTTETGASYLTNWYQGVTHTKDVWWKIQASEGTAERFFVPDTRAEFDVEDPAIDETGSYIGWRNAADKSLWMLRISE